MKTWKVNFINEKRLPEGWSIEVAARSKSEATSIACNSFENEFDCIPFDIDIEVMEID